MPDPIPKPTAAAVVQHYKERYQQIAVLLHEWEQRKAGFLVEIGRECLALVRSVLEPLGDAQLTERKNERASVVKELETELPELEGVGVPQVNRWMRWAAIGEVLAGEPGHWDLTWPCGLKQNHLMVLEKFIEQHEPTAVYRLKGPWTGKEGEIRDVLKLTIESGASAAELEAAIDGEANIPTPPPKESALPCPTPGTEAPEAQTPLQPSDEKSHADSTDSKASSKKSDPTCERSPGPTTSCAKGATPSKSASKTPATSSASSSAMPPVARPQSQPTASADLSSQDLANQAFKLMQTPEILAGVFRRAWTPELALLVMDNLIRAIGEDNKNLIAVAKMYHRALPLIRSHFDEEEQPDGRVRLTRKQAEELAMA